MAHCISAEAEAILDKEFKVLDKGFVRLVDYLGNDERIVESARVSYGKGTKTSREDKGLISYLLRNDHTSPFEQVIFTFHVKLPIFVARQWVRHRTARLNEISGRYSVMEDHFYVPDAKDIAFQSTNNKQGRSTESVPLKITQKIIDLLKSEQAGIYSNYQAMLDDGIARELARINLPLSLYTQWYWQIDLNNLMHFLRLRLDGHAQKEIRAYGDVMLMLAKLVCPAAIEAFVEHKVKGVSLSGAEKDAILAQLNPDTLPLDEKARTRLKEKLGIA